MECASEPFWSFDGQRIAYTVLADERRDLYVMDADGSNQTRLTFGADTGN